MELLKTVQMNFVRRCKGEALELGTIIDRVVRTVFILLSFLCGLSPVRVTYHKKTAVDYWGMFHWPHAFLLPNHVRLLQGKIIYKIIDRRPACVVQWLNHLGAMCSRV